MKNYLLNSTPTFQPDFEGGGDSYTPVIPADAMQDIKAGVGESENAGENNDQDNLEDFNSIWNNEPESETPAPQANSYQQSQDQQTPEQRIEAFVDSQGFASLNEQSLQTAVNSLGDGDIKPFMQLMQGMQRETFLKGVHASTSLANNTAKQTASETLNRATSQRQTAELVKQMNQDMEFTASPAVAPIANAALSRFIGKGQSPAEAVKSVRKFFQHVQQTSEAELADSSPQRRGVPGAGGFGNGPSRRQQETDFDEILRGM